MRYTLNITLLASLLACIAVAAEAGSTIVDAIKRRDDLSMFYQALVNTGVIKELENGGSFSVFAPTNEAFEKISPQKYPCFYSPQCKEEVADILRHHIIADEVYVDTIAQHQGGTYTVDGQFLSVGEPFKGKYIAGGQNVTSINMLGGNVLYKIDGVITGSNDILKIEEAKYAMPEEKVVVVKKTTVTECQGEDCPDEVPAEAAAAPAAPAELAPAR